MKRTRIIFGLIFSVFCIFACLGVSAFATDYEAPPQASDGYYELDSYEDLVWFQQYIDEGNLDINARLTADIYHYMYVLDSNGNLNRYDVPNWKPIGRDKIATRNQLFNGTLDGAGHTISGLCVYYEDEFEEYCGLFAATKEKSVIKNLNIVDSFFGGEYCSSVGSFVGYCEGRIENCYSSATLYGDDCAGIAAGARGSMYENGNHAYIENCFFNGKIKGFFAKNIDAITNKGHVGVIVKNNYYNENCGADDTQSTAVTDAQIASGEVAHLLNGDQSVINWYQNIDKGERDNLPVLNPEHYRVYKSGNTYTNDESKHSHLYINGFCVVCNEIEEPKLVDEYYEIGNYGNLVWLQQYIDAGNVNINARLTANIVANENLLDSNGDVQGKPKYTWTSIGRSYKFNGIFDGAGYSISGLYTYDTQNYCGLFARLNGTIKNLSIVDSYFESNRCYYVSTFAGITYGDIENCYSSATVSGRSMCGGIAGVTDRKISNCLFNGKITTEDLPNAICYGDENTNCYYNENCGGLSSRATSVTDDQLASGEVAYLLNGDYSVINWYQNVDKGEKDKLPTLNSEHYKVYKGESQYTNDIDKHIHMYANGVCNVCNKVCIHEKYENGICVECNSIEEPQLVDDCYEIANYGNLIWFQQYVDAGNVNINAKLTTNIVANENLLDSSGNVQGTPKYNWTPIGRGYSNSSDSYNGVFDGIGYSISGLYSNGTENYCGFFGKMNKGTIKNLSIVDSYFGGENCSYVGTFIGINVSNSSVENCYSNATTVGKYYCGGIAGETKGTVSNCLYNGKIKGTMNSNAIASDRYNEGTITNCYYNENCGLSSSRATAVTDDQLSSGEVAYLLNSDQSAINWYQNVDKGEKDNAPTLSSEHYRVYKGDNIYTNDLDKHSHVYNKGVCDICNKVCTHEKYEKGICIECNYGVEEPKLVDGYYEISSYGNLIWFQRYVDAGNVRVNAKLITNIIANENLLDSSGNVQGTPKYNWIPIGRDYLPYDSYDGIFDGAGYSISGLYGSNIEFYLGLFGKVHNGTIKNLSIVDSYFGGNSCGQVGTFIGFGYGNIENCYSNATIVGSSYCGGIAGSNGRTVSNCLYNGKITGESSSNAITADNGDFGKLTNCYYNENCGLSSDRATAVTDKQLASGEVAYLLNSDQSAIKWYQNIDKGEKDNAPTLSSEHYRVYKGDNIYTNDIDKHIHIYNNGICDICNKVCAHEKYEKGVCSECNYGVEEPQLVDNYYEISSYGNLIWFQRYVDAGNVRVNAKLITNIVANENLLDSSGNVQGTPKYNWIPIGRVSSYSSNSYRGIFDGAGYSISGLYGDSTEDYCGFFGKVDNGTIKNLSIVDSYFGENGRYYVGTFVGFGYGNIENCYSNATIVGKQTCGGIIGQNRGTVSDCLYNGKITGNNNSNAIASDTNNIGTLINCYYNENCGLSSSRATAVTDDQLSSGEVAYLLNSDKSAINWYQNVDRGEKDNVPTLNSEHYTVYKKNNGYTNILLGDVNDDGKVDRKDAVLILKNISGVALDKFSTENADYNGDGAINSLDVIAIMKNL